MTERMQVMLESEPGKYVHVKPENMETPEFTGHIIWALLNEPELMMMSGKTLIGAELAMQYGIVDAEGRQPPSYRERYGVTPGQQHSFTIKG